MSDCQSIMDQESGRKIILTCDRCEHWEKNLHSSWGFCTCPKLDSKSMADDEARMLVADGPPDIHTGPKFGCIHWQGKEGA